MAESGLARLRRRGLGFVFQGIHLLDELTAAENVELPALLAGASPRSGDSEPRSCSGRWGWPIGATTALGAVGR